MSDSSPVPQESLDPIERALAQTPARVLVGRAGLGYRTSTWLRLREDHAAARDAVYAEIDLERDFGAERVTRFGLFGVETQVTSKSEYLRRPDLGRKLSDVSRERVRAECSSECDFQVVIGDGLSATAVATQAPELLDRLHVAATQRGWSFGRPFLVRHCRVGVMNDVGDLLAPAVVVLLIGERPGLATAESLSAYMAFRPRGGHTDADRNLISNIHARGVGLAEAAQRIIALAEQFRAVGRSGVGVTEVLDARALSNLASISGST
ncbi:ethanolamine ammonia-lyase : Ethanolamine ammonia-lyase light chain OS=Singulisphaera acidiphila (strain ATCC BAA-1392 / DSM 18658 / VKM B-2454 / MOB10) GN=Sinac_5208 PE=4 SV=1: EutC [Gemmata massiliana]|uniref:Ethanolamine ammonia-lyase small subunit n=1 Tax=Gemmata massiliana TaxID=1210884 RepID=A0A6P2D1A4_9BACT|nr:ethanolamine ammonia-lyase subunit EutC [Gemmata massiliana]VTR94627.1 ethanolamine ammonia-lyase : Ethanolamine ammonia-lyase light chain OS=Singulisphaera acidiphila (strain ATCC BAA-1392 / DSM 18658 / VKM B-2454 / MOB10) GN=Sinac_5208 PE=4 SV=1: EutC [Gemmata massiliana]